jgi:eukaryotic-like serine/threonine-protein kinase
MAILPGLRLGPYEILSAIGAGGMGEVYRAKDTRLGRIVAIKVLPPHLADSLELRERFEREARTIGSLNHPHICTLYDIGQPPTQINVALNWFEELKQKVPTGKK